MKKILIICILLSNMLLFSQFRVGYGTSTDYVLSYGGTTLGEETLNGGLTLGYDHTLSANEQTEYGIGAEIMLERKDPDDAVGVAFNSFYGYAKYAFTEQAYGYARLGYNTHKLTGIGASAYTFGGGINYGVGVGYNMSDKISLQATYLGYSGTATTPDGIEYDGKYTNVNIGLIFSL